MKNVFNENDLKSLFSPAPAEPMIQVVIEKPEAPTKIEEPKVGESAKRGPADSGKVYAPEKFTLQLVTKFAALFIVILFASYFLINAQAVSAKLRYFFDVKIKKSTYSAAVPTPTANLFNPSAEARLVIPKIGVEAPISWNTTDSNLNETLLSGIAHSAGTALPGQVGNIFLVGHSSYYSWVKSDYKNVFTLLDQLNPGDKIYLQSASTVFTYQVNDSIVVSSQETWVMDQGPGYNLSLMTCVPVGTNLNRLIVRTTQVNE